MSKRGGVTDPPWGGLIRMMGVFRSWGGCLDTLIITCSLGLSGTCADSIEVDGRGRTRVDGGKGYGPYGAKHWVSLPTP
eukprot:3135971-Prymnesium_polylepis.1